MRHGAFFATPHPIFLSAQHTCLLMKRLPPLNALRAFTIAAQTGSFTRAGQLLHVTQGAISRQVKLLETSLDVQLFDRVHQSISLTPTGQALAEALGQAFDHMEAAVDAALQTPPRTLLSINVPPTFATRWLAPRLSDFRKQHPHVDLSITTDRISHHKACRHHDCVIFFDQHAWPTLPCEQLLLEQHIVVCSPALWHGPQPPLLQEATLLHILDGDKRLPVWEQWVTAHGLTHLDTQSGLSFSTLDQAINASVAGAGVVVVDKTMVTRELNSGALKRLDDREMHGPLGYWFAQVSQNVHQQQWIACFRDWLLSHTRLAEPEAP